MKKVLFSLMALAIALTACKKEEQIVPEIKADKTEINVPVTGTEDAEEDTQQHTAEGEENSVEGAAVDLIGILFTQTS